MSQSESSRMLMPSKLGPRTEMFDKAVLVVQYDMRDMQDIEKSFQIFLMCVF